MTQAKDEIAPAQLEPIRAIGAWPRHGQSRRFLSEKENVIERISGKITDKDGQTTVGVIGTMDVVTDSDGSIAGWRGELKLVVDTSITPGAFTLALDDGRRGNILITSMRENVGTRNAAAFVGQGPVPVKDAPRAG